MSDQRIPEKPKSKWRVFWKLTGLSVMWMFLPITALFKMQDTVDREIDNDRKKEQTESEANQRS